MQMKRFEALDGWRGIAALAVAFYHVPIAHPLRALAGWKNWELFVDLFFVLSGFVIMHAWGKRLSGVEAGKEFIARRFWRLWPLHFGILFVLFGLEALKLGLSGVIALPQDGAPFTDTKSWATLLSNILMTQSLNLHGTTSWNLPAWSISAEFWTYLVFAAVMLGLRTRSGLVLLAIAGLALLGLALNSPIFLFATHDFGLLRSIFGFFVGAATYQLVASDRFEMNGGTALEISVTLLLGAYLLTTGVNATSYLAPLVFAGLIIVFSQARGVLSRVLESRPIQALGLWSYSIYLVHALLFYLASVVLQASAKLGILSVTSQGFGGGRVYSLGGGMADALAIIALLGVTIIISAWSYRWIEKPFMATAAKNPATGSQSAFARA